MKTKSFTLKIAAILLLFTGTAGMKTSEAIAKERETRPERSSVAVKSEKRLADFSWEEQATGFTSPSRGINAIHAVNDSIVWAVAYDGSGNEEDIQEFTKTTNGGATWMPGSISGHTNTGIANIHGISDTVAYASLYPTAAGGSNGIYKTMDGGQTWAKQGGTAYSAPASFINFVTFFNDSTGFAQGDPVDSYFELYTTTDAGANWVRVPQANIPAPIAADEYGIVNVFTTQGDTIWFGTNKGRIFKSIDKGMNWTVTAPFGTGVSLMSLAFGENGNGAIVGIQSSQVRFARTTDGGATWTTPTTTPLAGINPVNDITYVPGTPNTFVIAGSSQTETANGTAYSVDGGATWTAINQGQQHLEVEFTSPFNGWSGGFNQDEITGGMFKFVGSFLVTTARLQVIHNVADLAADSVDVYINGDLLLDNFAFRTATPFIDAPAGQELVISIAAKNSADTAGALFSQAYTLDTAATYVLIASGIVSPTGYTPNPGFELKVYPMALENSAAQNETQILVYHGATDAPTVDLTSQGGGATLVDNISYGEFSDGYLTLPANDVNIEVRDETGAIVVASYALPLGSMNLGGQALTALASGFLDPSENSNGPAFGIYVATAEGGELMLLPTVTSVAKNISENFALNIFPNPATTGNVNISYKLTKSENISFGIYDLKGSLVNYVNEGMRTAGDYNINLSTANMPSGMYFVKIQTADNISTVKMVIE